MKKEKIWAQLENLASDVHGKIERAKETIELTFGTNGYPEPYAGTGIIPTSVEDAQELEKWAEEKEKEIQELLNDISDALEEKNLTDEEKKELEHIEDDLRDVDIGPGIAAWKSGWSFAKFDMSFSFEYITREKDGNITLVKKLSGLFFCKEIDEAIAELPNADEVGAWLKRESEKRDMEEIDILSDPGEGAPKIDGVLVEEKTEDWRNVEYFCFETEEEAIEYMNETVVDGFSSHDSNHTAPCLRIFGFTGDLYDRLKAGGGTVQTPFQGAMKTNLNIPRYSHR